MPDGDKIDNVKALFGGWKPVPGTTKVLVERAENALKMLQEHKVVAFGAVAIDHEGQAHMFFGTDPLQDNVLIGGLEVLKFNLLSMQNYRDDTPKGSDDDQPG